MKLWTCNEWNIYAHDATVMLPELRIYWYTKQTSDHRIDSCLCCYSFKTLQIRNIREISGHCKQHFYISNETHFTIYYQVI
jgi:hypothetical protein